MSNETSLEMHIVFNNTVLTTLKQRNTATSMRDPDITLTMKTEFTGPYAQNWLYLAALRQTNYWGTGELTMMPYRPDMLTVNSMIMEGIQSHWIVLEDIYEHRAWAKATQCVVAMSGDVYGGTLTLNAIKPPYELWTKKFYNSSLIAESARLVPLVPGRVTGVQVKDGVIEVDIKYEFDAIMTPFDNQPSYDPSINPDSVMVDMLLSMQTTQNEALWNVITSGQI